MAGLASRGQVGAAPMDNVTALATHACFLFSLGLFALVAGVSNQKEAPVRGKVRVWAYVPKDLLGVAGIFGIFYLFSMANIMATESEEEMKLTVDGMVFSMGFQVFMAVGVTAIMAPRVPPVAWLGLKWGQWPLVIAIAPVTVLCMWALFAGLYQIGYMDLMDKLGVEKVQESVTMFQTEQNPVLIGMMALAAGLFAPVCEEVVFRGYLYPVAKKFSGPWVAALCSALVFSAAHGSMAALFPLFIFGLVLVALYEWTGSIWAPISVHFLFNAATVAIQLGQKYYGLEQTVAQ